MGNIVLLDELKTNRTAASAVIVFVNNEFKYQILLSVVNRWIQVRYLNMYEKNNNLLKRGCWKWRIQFVKN